MSFPALPCAGGWKHCGAGIVYDLSLLPLLAQPFGSAEPHKQTKNNYIYIKKKALGTRHFKVSLNVGKKVCWKCFVLCVWSKMLSLPRMLRAQLFPLKQTMPVAKWHKGKLSSPCIVPLLTEVGFPPNPCTPS